MGSAPIVKPSRQILDVIEAQKAKLETRLPKGMDVDKFILGLATAIQKSVANSKPGKSLADCDPASVLLAAYEAAELGCDLSPSLGLGWLINYGGVAQFQPSYRFFIQKAYETGDVRSFFAEVVYAGDKLDRQYSPRKLFHKPGGERKREQAIGAYAMIEFKDGTVDWEYLTHEQISRHRNVSKQPNSMKWVEFWEEGWRITPIRVLAKRLPIKGRNLESFVNVINRELAVDEFDTSKVGNDAIADGVPRRMTERLAEINQEQAPEPQPQPQQDQATQSAEPQADQPAQPAQAAQPAQTNASMFNEGSDPFVTQAEVTSVWDKAFDIGWKKPELTEFLKKNYQVQAPKDLHKSQLQGALDQIEKARK